MLADMTEAAQKYNKTLVTLLYNDLIKRNALAFQQQ